jgi:hypothetical protein
MRNHRQPRPTSRPALLIPHSSFFFLIPLSSSSFLSLLPHSSFPFRVLVANLHASGDHRPPRRARMTDDLAPNPPSRHAAGSTAQRIQRRHRLAALVQELYAGRLTSAQFFRDAAPLADPDDPETVELLRRLSEEPAKSWLFGVGDGTHEDGARRIRELVESLSR